MKTTSEIKKAKEKNDGEIINIKTLSTLKKRILSLIPVYIVLLTSAGIKILTSALNTSIMSYWWKITIWSICILTLSCAALVEKAQERLKSDPERSVFVALRNALPAPFMLIIYIFGAFDEPLSTFFIWANLNKDGSLYAIQFIILVIGFVLVGIYNLFREAYILHFIQKQNKSVVENENNEEVEDNDEEEEEE